ncbi:hypothetical protein M0R45_022542 [Rubus argutus]|uniref:Uncharacterized protein n=1 Tax=Rubus argutus TaxID=59490 RepID=A0AAW1XGC9_RUBAR
MDHMLDNVEEFRTEEVRPNCLRIHQKRDRWKLKMLEKSKGATTDMASDDEFRSASIERKVQFSASTDDEEMAEWFGNGKL